MSQIFRCQGADIRELTVSRTGDAFNLSLKTYVLECWRTLELYGVRELPDIQSLLEAARVEITEESDSGREFGAVRIDVLDEASEEFFADECTIS